MNKVIHIIFLVFIASGCKKSISEADYNQITELNEKAVQYGMENNLEKAKEFYAQALAIDKSNSTIRYALIAIFVQQDSMEKAFEVLEKTPVKQKETEFYYQIKGELFEHTGAKQQAIESYKNALKLAKKPKVKDEMDLMPLVNYAMLETLSGKKEQAVNRLNKSLKLNWLTESNKEYIITFRNEFQFYQGNGTLEFDPKSDILIKTTNPDSLKSILKENHINISSSSFSHGNDTTEIYLSEKYRDGINKLNIKTHPNNVYEEW